jgi:hypothetical protein
MGPATTMKGSDNAPAPVGVRMTSKEQADEECWCTAGMSLCFHTRWFGEYCTVPPLRVINILCLTLEVVLDTGKPVGTVVAAVPADGVGAPKEAPGSVSWSFSKRKG